MEFAEWAAPIVPVIKRDGSVRICGDYKVTVNRVAKVDSYPLPRIDDLFASLAGDKLFSKLVLAHAYQQIPLAEESKTVIVINTHKGLYRYNRLSFGISSTPAIFQRMIEGILQGIPHVTFNINDILVTGATHREHLPNLQEVLTRLEKAGLKLKKDKCVFMLTAVEYLGHEITEAGLKPTAEKVRALVEAPVPKDVSQLQSFLGVVNYYAKFMPNQLSALAPLNQLLQKSGKWSWGSAQSRVFQAAKEALTLATVLTHYNPDLDLVLDCDASPYGVGAVLSHRLEDGSTRPIAFASRFLNPVERRYSHLDLMRPSVASRVTRAQERRKLVMTRRARTDSSQWVTRYLFGTSQPAQRG